MKLNIMNELDFMSDQRLLPRFGWLAPDVRFSTLSQKSHITKEFVRVLHEHPEMVPSELELYKFGPDKHAQWFEAREVQPLIHESQCKEQFRRCRCPMFENYSSGRNNIFVLRDRLFSTNWTRVQTHD